MEKSYLSVSDIDPLDTDVFELIIKINKLPFISTLSSCSGHLNNAKPFQGNAPKGKFFCDDGHLIFTLDKTTEAKEFLDRLREIIKNYSLISMLPWENKNSREVNLKFEGELKTEKYFFGKKINIYEIDEEKGLEQLSIFRKFWKDFEKLVETKLDPKDIESVRKTKLALLEEMDGTKSAITKNIRFI